MSEINVLDFIVMILKEIYPGDEQYDSGQVRYMLDNLRVYGKDNQHLYSMIDIKDHRLKPLDENETINGDYLLFSCLGNSGILILMQYNTLEELEKNILSSYGYINPFITDCIAVVNNKIKKYNIYFKNNLGRRDCVRKFKKGKHDIKYSNKNLSDNWIEWID